MHHVIKSSNQMELPVNNGDDSKMDTNNDVSELLALSYDMSFGDSSPPDNKWPFKEWSNELLQKENDSFIDNANNQILKLISESRKEIN